jgi:hypothetical protein
MQKMKKNNLKLFLDDIRMPDAAFIYEERVKLIAKSGVQNCEWNIVRNYEDFCEFIDTFGIPEVVSFDHDLCEEHMNHYFTVTSQIGVIEYGNLKTKTGKHCAEYFVGKWREAGKPTVKVYVHSANRWGQVEIKKVLKELL